MSELFEIDGPNLDLGYINLREGKFSQEREIHEKLQAMWQTYEPYADADFRLGFARDPEGRFWEMYLGWALLEAGKMLLPRSGRETAGGQPDICVIHEERRSWIEATAPDCGKEGPDRVQGPRPINEGGGFEPSPTRQAQLRLRFGQRAKSFRDTSKLG